MQGNELLREREVHKEAGRVGGGAVSSAMVGQREAEVHSAKFKETKVDDVSYVKQG